MSKRRHLFNLFFTVTCSLMNIACLTTYYHQVSPSLTSKNEEVLAFNFQDAPIKVECEYLEDFELIDAPLLCDRIRSNLDQQRAKVSSDSAEKAEDDFVIRVKAKLINESSSSYENILYFLSYGSFPRVKERWFTVTISVYDPSFTLIHADTFKAMFEVYDSWVFYWVVRGIDLFREDKVENAYLEKHSHDFYSFVNVTVNQSIKKYRWQKGAEISEVFSWE